MATPETQAIVQDSCERWHLCLEYARKWSPGAEKRLVLAAAMRKELRTAVKDLNAE